jgi:DNA (cytosine-5)-methyltransferase 1
MFHRPQPTAISLFSGAGGCSAGFRQAGFNIPYAQDIDKDCIESYATNFPDTFCEVRDIRDTDFASIRKEIGHDIDIVIGGPPCQGFSTAGARNTNDPRNKLLDSYVDALNILKPKWFLFENVEGLLTLNHGKYVASLVQRLIEIGYTLRVEKVYSQAYNVPQRRKRVILVGNRFGEKFEFPAPKLPISGNIFRKSNYTLRLAIGGLPSPTSQKGAAVPYLTTPESEFEKYIRGKATQLTEHYAPDMNGLQIERLMLLAEGCTMKNLPEHLQHESFKKRAFRRVMDGTPTEKRGGAPSGIKRLFFDEPSLTITSSSTRELIHPEAHRPLTLRECARIQTFKDDFIFCGNENSKIKQIGNAIPPLLAYEFAVHFKMLIADEGGCARKLGGLLGFDLTKADAMSPALQNTIYLLSQISNRQLQLFEAL